METIRDGFQNFPSELQAQLKLGRKLNEKRTELCSEADRDAFRGCRIIRIIRERPNRSPAGANVLTRTEER